LANKLLQTFLLLSCLVICACSPYSRFPTAKGTAPQNDKEAVISAALTRAIVDKEIPAFDLLTKDPRVALKNETLFNSDSMIDSLGSGALPQSAGVRFILVSSAQIQDLAERSDSFVYVSVPSIHVIGNQATVVISTVLTTRKNNGIAFKGGGWFELAYVKTSGNWHFDQVLDSSSI
jgi:hypothetical protein